MKLAHFAEAVQADGVQMVGEDFGSDSVALPGSERPARHSCSKNSEVFPKAMPPLRPLGGRHLHFAENQQSCWGIIWLMF